MAGTNAELAPAKARADETAMRLEATLARMSDGIAMVNGDLELMEWNDWFPRSRASRQTFCVSAWRWKIFSARRWERVVELAETA